MIIYTGGFAAIILIINFQSSIINWNTYVS